MNFSKKIYLSFWSTVIIFLITSISDVYILNRPYDLNSISKNISLNLEELSKVANTHTNALFSLANSSVEDIKADSINFDTDISYFIYKDDTLVFWTNNSIPLEKNLDEAKIQLKDGFFDPGNGYYFILSEKHSNELSVFAIYRVYVQYSLQNQYLRSGFNADLNISSKCTFSILQQSNLIPVVFKGQTEFYIGESKDAPSGDVNFYMNIAEWILLILIMIFGSFYFSKGNRSYTSNIFGLSFTIFVYLSLKYFNFPPSLAGSDFFSPLYYASSSTLNSLGDLLLFSIILVFTMNVINEVSKEQLINRVITNSNLNKYLIAIALGLFGFVGILGLYNILSGLVLNSTIIFDSSAILDLDYFSVAGLAIIAFVIHAMFLICKLLNKLMENLGSGAIVIGIYTVVCAILFTLLNFDSGIFDTIGITAYQLFFVLAFFTINTFFNRYKLISELPGSSILKLLLYSILAVVIVIANSSKKEKESRLFMASRLLNEQDLIAEYLYSDVVKQVTTDTSIINFFNLPYDSIIVNYSNIEVIRKNLNLRLNSGYWDKYDVTIRSFYGNGLPLNYIGDPSWNIDFIEKTIDEYGKESLSEGLYYTGASNLDYKYIGRILVDRNDLNSNDGVIYLLFREKFWKTNAGFPDLLLSESVPIKKTNKSDYSSAVYLRDSLISSEGAYNYGLFQVKDVLTKNSQNFFIDTAHHSHLIHHDGEKIVVISKRNSTVFSYVTLFAYILTFFGIAYLAYKVSGKLYSIRKIEPLNLKQRIQVSIIGVVVSAIIMIGIASLFLIRRDFQENTISEATEKLKSLAAIITDDLKERERDELNITDDLYFRYNQLSEMVGNDFSIFDANGNLAYTTQPKIYEQRLTGEIIHHNALLQLKQPGAQIFYQYENIGSLNYLSVYEKVVDNSNNVIGYLNMPYFAKEADLKNDISNFLMALINIYVLLFSVAILLAIFIAHRITRPLEIIQGMMAKVRYGRSNEYIQWKTNDEIGTLIAQYNRMVTELEVSAKKLAESERETAWREMAKQVAHEIKNPLTPMKLNVQHLEKARREGYHDMDGLISKLTKTLSEQIDVLSNIATEFANFAKMPKAKNEVLQLQKIIADVVVLFDKEFNIKIDFKTEITDPCFIYADKEQMGRAFSNILKNAIQSIPEERLGLIEISLSYINKGYMIAIKDNGTGINTEDQAKIFVPNFTTKSGGTGLGLAMVKNIIVGSGGSIWFESVVGHGTTFFIYLPKTNQ